MCIRDRVEVDTLLLNGAECEPYLTADHRLMVERPRDIIRGAQILMRAIGVMRTRIGIEDNKPDAIHAMRDAAAVSYTHLVCVRIAWDDHP